MTYRRAGLREEQDFKPVAFEMLGGWDEEGVILLKRITSILARNQGKDKEETGRFLVHRVSRYPVRECRVFRGLAA